MQRHICAHTHALTQYALALLEDVDLRIFLFIHLSVAHHMQNLVVLQSAWDSRSHASGIKNMRGCSRGLLVATAHAHNGDPTPSVPADSSLSLSPPSHHGAQLGRDPTAAGSTLSPWQHVWDVTAAPPASQPQTPARPPEKYTERCTHTGQ